MSLFRPGTASGDGGVARPVWPQFTAAPRQSIPAPGTPAHGAPASAGEQAAAALQTAPLPPVVLSVAPAPPSLPRAEYEEILRQARLEAAQILQEAAIEAEQAVENARQEGALAGRREGLAAGQAEAERLKQEVQAELQRARSQTETARRTAEANAQAIRVEAEGRAQSVLAGAREEAAAILEAAREEQGRRLDAIGGALLELAVSAAQRLVQGHLAIAPEAIVQMLAAGLRRLKDSNCTVRVSPQDLPLLEAQRSTLERELATGFLQLQPDPGLLPGNYIVSSPQGQIDGRLDKQLGVVRSALTSAMGGTGT